MSIEQLPLDFTASATVRQRRAVKAAADTQPTLFAFAPNVDVHLHSATEAVASLAGADPDRAQAWLSALVGQVRPLRSRRVAFPARSLDRLLHVMPPAQVTLDAGATAVARGLWAAKIGLRPLRVTKDGGRLLASSPRWPTGFRVKDAPWPAIAALVALDVPLEVDPDAQVLMNRRLADSGQTIAAAGLAGSAVLLETTRPGVLESWNLPGLAYAGEPGTGRYRMPLLLAAPLLDQPLVRMSDELRAAIRKASTRPRPLPNPEGFPWQLFPFQARDAGQALRILDTTGGVLLAGDMGSGKCQPVSEPVLTPGGWRPIGDLQTGDLVMGRDGLPHRVLGVYPQGEKDIFEVVLNDGCRVRCSDEHLWQVRTRAQVARGTGGQVLALSEIRTSLRDPRGQARYLLPQVAALDFGRDFESVIDPYVLGVWLGDGRCEGAGSTPQFCGVDEQIAAEVSALLPASIELRETARSYEVRRWSMRKRPGIYRNVVTGELRRLGLVGCGAPDKFIPPEYMTVPIAARVGLLQGLMDTDGGMHPRQGARFTTTSPALRDGVAELVRSLGGVARVRVKVKPGTTYTYRGQVRPKLPAWDVSMTLPPGITPFRLRRKADMYRPRSRGHVRRIEDVQPAGREETVCISVDSPDKLYLTTGTTPVHNTTVSLALVAHKQTWPLLVVAPLMAFSTWARQLGELGKSYYLAVEAPGKSWEEIENGSYDAVVISYDRLHAFVELIERKHFAAVIADEAQRIRTPGSRRSRALRQIAGAIPVRIALSGTPLTNGLADVLPIGSFVAPSEWKPRTNHKDLEDLYPGDPVEAVTDHLGSVMVRRRMADTGAALPDRRDHRVYVELTPEQRRALADLEAEAEAAKEAGEFEDGQAKWHAFQRLHRMRQIVNSPRQAGLTGPNPKVTSALDLAEDFLASGRKGVIFCADRAVFTELSGKLTEAGIGHVGIWGSTPPVERIALEKKFHTDPECKIVLATIQAASESVTFSPTATWLLTTAYVYAPSTLAQMEARVYRLNQTNPVDIVYLHATAPGGSLDDRMVEILEVKKALFAKVVDRMIHEDSTEVHYSLSDLLFLITGKKDEKVAAREADAKAAREREQAAKRHARVTAHRHKGKNKTSTDWHDDGSSAVTAEEWAAAHGLDEDADLDELLAAAEADE